MRVDGQEIRRQRELRGWSQPELAKAAGIASGTVSHVEQGLAIYPKTAKAVADALEIPLERVYIDARKGAALAAK